MALPHGSNGPSRVVGLSSPGGRISLPGWSDPSGRCESPFPPRVVGPSITPEAGSLPGWSDHPSPVGRMRPPEPCKPDPPPMVGSSWVVICDGNVYHYKFYGVLACEEQWKVSDIPGPRPTSRRCTPRQKSSLDSPQSRIPPPYSAFLNVRTERWRSVVLPLPAFMAPDRLKQMAWSCYIVPVPCDLAALHHLVAGIDMPG